jgi:hypothetical protein
MRRILAALTAVGLLVLTATSGVYAARRPTRAERQAITNALPKYVRAMPVGCIWLNIRVSTTNPRFAYVAPEIMNATPPNTQCLRYASNGYFVLKRGASGRWVIIYNGSSGPPCSLRIPRDLVRCY